MSLPTETQSPAHPQSPASGTDSVVGCSSWLDRLEALRVKLCAVGLCPKHHDTPEKAADAVVEMIAYFRAELANPPADVCSLVLEKYGVEGFTGDKPARCRIVSLSNNAVSNFEANTAEKK